MTDRAVSTVANYAVLLGIVTLLISGLFVGTSGLVTGQQERVIRSELTVLGNQIAADLGAADRLARQAGESGTMRATLDLPEHVGGSTYRIRVTDGATDTQYELTLLSTAPEVSVTILVRTHLSLATGTVDGGDIAIVYTAPDTLEVRNA